jgi:hypothetical protein
MRLFALLGFVLVGCTTSGPDGGSGPGGGGGNGGGGGGFDTSDTISAMVTTSDGGDTSSTAEIVLASTANLCSDASASPAIDRKGQHFISIELRDVNGATRTAPTAPGTYAIYANTGSEPAKAASFTVGVLDDTCQLIDTDSASGQSGTVTLTSITAGVYAGSYDVVLNTGGHVTGSFHPTACPQLATALATVDQHSCK